MLTFLKKYSTSIVIILLAILFFLQLTSSLQESQTIDEGPHLSGGYSYLITHDFRLNPEHPPLLKMLAALPLLIMNPELPTDHQSWENADQWAFAQQFLYHNTRPADDLLLLGRIPIMILGLILALSVYLIAKKLLGKTAALLAFILTVFEPNIIAHSRYITTDIGVSLLFLISIYYFGEYLNSPNFKTLITSAFFLGLAQMTKFSAVILIPIFLTLFVVKLCHSSGASLKKALKLKFITISLLAFLVIPAGIIHLSYLANISVPDQDIQVQNLLAKRDSILSSPQDDVPFISRTLARLGDPKTVTGKIFEKTIHSRVPFFHYFRGLANLLFHNYTGHTSYLMGTHSETGFWYYFPIAFLVKTPLALIILLLITLNHMVRKFFYRIKKSSSELDYTLLKPSVLSRAIKRCFSLFKNTIKILQRIPFYYFLLIVPVIIYFLISMGSSINIGVRHILPIFPFVIIMASRTINFPELKAKKVYSWAVLIIVIAYVISSLVIYPNYLSYFSELVGGANNGHRHLLDSNLDWGQDLKKLKKVLSENNIQEIQLVYFGQANLWYYDIPAVPLPTIKNQKSISEIDGWVGISATALYSDGELSWLRNMEPDEKIGYSIFIYDLRKN